MPSICRGRLPEGSERVARGAPSNKLKATAPPAASSQKKHLVALFGNSITYSRRSLSTPYPRLLSLHTFSNIHYPIPDRQHQLPHQQFNHTRNDHDVDR